MKRSFLILTLFGLLTCLSGYSQEQEFEDTRLFYRSDVSGGAMAHSNGFGAFFRKSKRKTGFKKSIYSIELVNMKHPKEYKIFNQFFDDTKGYVYGKMNSVMILRPSFGKQKAMYTKETKRGVQISYVLMGGPSLAFLKPIYLQIAYPFNSPGYEYITTEKYNPSQHAANEIYSKSPYMKGIEETVIYPGAQGKFGINFEYAPLDDMIRAIETGIIFDIYHKKVPIMASFPVDDPNGEPKNHQYFISLYVHFQLGKKSF